MYIYTSFMQAQKAVNIMGSSKAGSASLKRSYEDFEPFCKWEKEEGRHILVLHLLEFKKQQLRVQVNNLGALTISGERPLDETRWSRFRKEMKIASNVNTNEIRAKFSCGILSIIMPLKSPSFSKANGKSKLEVDQDKGIENPTNVVATKFAALCKPTVGLKSLVSGLRMDKMTALKVAMAVAAAAAIGAYVAYKFRLSHDDN